MTIKAGFYGFLALCVSPKETPKPENCPLSGIHTASEI